ncbi:uncharacterized protein LOC121367417 [Gigantopelta aegis]|uniref:uncharacterized protein LOC121367417 n=1 Tax=Gigantopelta aegis TaxID=1735272 RepID=UPI001B88A96A|nr:uncharacterized protein LOC121367417 [Gigantopelta aegis]
MADRESHDVSHLVASDSHDLDTSRDLKFESNFADMVSAGHVNVAFDASSTDPLPSEHSQQNGNGHLNAAFEESSADPLPNENFQQNGSSHLDGNANLDHAKCVQDGTTDADTSISISRPVVFDNRGGHNVVLQERVMTTLPDGSRTIETRAIPERGRQFQRPLRARRITFIKIFSVIAAVMFFPTGIPACYYAFKTKKAFDEGLLQGNIDLAIKYVTRAERLIIVSIILAIVAGALALAMYERAVNAKDYSYHPGIIIGG